MPAAPMGTATAKGGGGGGSDPNVLSLKEANRIRILEPVTFKWRQHFIESTTDSEQGRPVVCPKGPDGRDQQPCPLCMKPVDADGKQRFPVSRRFATNVWDYESSSVKVLIAGPQVFEEFDAIVAVGLDITSTDFIIHKMGKNINTSYKVVRGDASPMPVQVSPEMMHDLSKYDTPDSTEKIFEKLEEMGVDYDALETPSFTLEQAESFQIPYGKSKGSTIESIVANDLDYALYMHKVKKDQGSYGDPVFIAFQTVLEDRGEVEALEETDAVPPAPAVSGGAKPAPADPEAQEATPVASGMVSLVGPDGTQVEVPAATADALRQAGYKDPEPVAEPATHMNVLIQGQVVNLDIDSANALIASGAATPADEAQPAPAEPAAPAYQLPGDEDLVELKLNVIPNPVPTAFKDAKRIVANGDGTFVDEQLATAVSADKQNDGEVASEVAAAAATDPTQPGGQASLDPALTVPVDGGFSHPAIENGTKVYKTKGGVTQALNKMKNAAPAADTSAPAPASENGTVHASSKDAKLEQAKNLLRDMPEIQSDFKKLLDLFEEVAGKRQITDFTEPELEALIERLQVMKATA